MTRTRTRSSSPTSTAPRPRQANRPNDAQADERRGRDYWNDTVFEFQKINNQYTEQLTEIIVSAFSIIIISCRTS